MLVYDDAVALFQKNNYEWNIDGNKRVPSKEDIQKAVAEMQRRLDDEPDGSVMVVGHLLVQKLEGRYDVYLHLGDTSEIGG